MVEEKKLLNHFFQDISFLLYVKALPLNGDGCFSSTYLLLLFHSCLLLQELWMWLVFKTSFHFRYFTSISLQPPILFSYDCGLHPVQETAKSCCSGDTPSWCDWLYLYGGAIFPQILYWISFRYLHECLSPGLVASVSELGEGALRCFRWKDGKARQLADVLLSLSTPTMLSNGVQQSNHQPCWVAEVACVWRLSLSLLEIPATWFLGLLHFSQKHIQYLLKCNKRCSWFWKRSFLVMKGYPHDVWIRQVITWLLSWASRDWETSFWHMELS